MKSGQSQRYLTKSRFKLALECPIKLFYTGKEYITYQNLLDVFDDESQREYYGILEVPRAIVMATVKAMRDELGSYSEVAEDPDEIAPRVLDDQPELTLEK